MGDARRNATGMEAPHDAAAAAKRKTRESIRKPIGEDP
jgi:hypothetical protein